MEQTPENISVSSLKPENTDTPNTHNTKEEKEGFFGEIFRFSILALIIVLPIRLFIAQPFIVSGASMESTFSTGQYLIVDQLSYRFDEPSRGDVVVFRYPKDPSKFFIKRIIGVPGDEVIIKGSDITVKNEQFPEGVHLAEPYVFHMTEGNSFDETLGQDEYFVMGDNRDFSSDSRSWGILPRDNIVGRAYVRLFPFSTVSILPGEYDTTSEFTEKISN